MLIDSSMVKVKMKICFMSSFTGIMPLWKSCSTIPPQHPGEYLKEKLSERGWTYQELAAIAGKSSRSISEIARCRSGVSAEMARAFGAAFGNSAEEWLKMGLSVSPVCRN